MTDKDKKKEEIILDIQRVARELSLQQIKAKEYLAVGNFKNKTIEYYFGSWGRAVQEAGLKSMPNFRNQKIPDEELLKAIVDLADELNGLPTSGDMNARGRFSVKPYIDRWGSFAKARDIALAGRAIGKIEKPSETTEKKTITRPKSSPSHPPLKGTVYGDFLNFRGLQHTPINEQGVVFLFGMVCKELGYIVEAVKTGFPDCEAKRRIAGRKDQWQKVSIEFEFQSRNFLDHGHDPEGCNVIVCWEHNWPDCPIEVLELKSEIKKLTT